MAKSASDAPAEEAAEAPKTVTVYCRIANGLTLTLDDKSGGADHRAVKLKAGGNEVDADFWAKWIEENPSFPPLVSGHIHAG
jgi:hypothetical protein